MKYGSICSGIEATTVAWHPIGWQPQFFAELDPFCSALLSQHYPSVSNYGNFTEIKADANSSIDLLVGGTPCQSFSLAGSRKGLDDPRGQLALEFIELAYRLRARWLVWENVRDVLSSNQGIDFGVLLYRLAQRGYGFAYRVLNAQYFGVPQRRRRVFVVGYSGDWRCAAAVLFEQQSLQRDIAQSKEARKIASALTATGVGPCGADDNQAQAGHLICRDIAPALTASYFKQPDNSDTNLGPNIIASCITTGEGRRQDAESCNLIAFSCKDHGADAGEFSPTLRAMGHDKSNSNGGGQVAIQMDDSVRQLTPRECERLQGFPDDYTLVNYKNKLGADSHRYKALGNSMAVPVMRWIGERIALVEQLINMRT